MGPSFQEAVAPMLEPVPGDGLGLSPGEYAAISQAISLKRIADALDGTALGVDVSESLAGLAHAMIYGRTS